MLNSGKYQKYFLMLIYLILSIAMTAVINTKGIIWGGDDMVYHIGRLISLKSSFQNGVIIPNISSSNFGLIGYGINLFYPWVTLVPMVIISMLIHDPITAYYVGLAFFMFVSFGISHYAMKRFSGSEKQAVIFSLIYSLANFRLIDVFSRADLAEYIATVFLPLAFLGFYETFFRNYHKWPILAAGMSLLLLSHVLTTVIVTFFFIVSLIFCWFMSHDYLARIKAGLAAIITAVLASAIFLFPFLAEISYQSYQQPSPYVLKGKPFVKMFSASLINDANRSLDGNIYNIGIVLLIALVLGIFFFKSFTKRYKVIYLLSVLSLWMVTDLFPWKVFQPTPLNVIQFPFRFLLIATLLLSVVATRIFAKVFASGTPKQSKFAIGILGIVMLGLWTNSVNGALHKNYLTSPNQTIKQSSIKSKQIYEGYYEQYSPASAQPHIKDIEAHVGYVDGQKITFAPSSKGKDIQVTIPNLQKNVQVDLPMIKYRYSTVMINHKTQKIQRSHRETVSFKTTKNYSKAVIAVGYRINPLVWSSLIISLLIWIWILLELIFKD